MARFNSILMILVYFGELPWFFYLFLNSCKNNTSIDFLLITDNEVSKKNIPGNVMILNKSIEEFQILVAKNLDIPVSIPYAYKLCDFKPTYGLIFSDIVKSYDFWGYGDIDVIYGNLRIFIDPPIQKSYEVITFRPEYLSGCFTLFKNNPRTNGLFFSSRDYYEVFTNDFYYNFDECNFLHGPLQNGYEIIARVGKEIESMTHVLKRNNQIKSYFDFHLLEGQVGNIEYRKGKLIYKNCLEIALYHFLDFKKNCQLKNLQFLPIDHFYISEKSIYGIT